MAVNGATHPTKNAIFKFMIGLYSPYLIRLFLAASTDRNPGVRQTVKSIPPEKWLARRDEDAFPFSAKPGRREN